MSLNILADRFAGQRRIGLQHELAKRLNALAVGLDTAEATRVKSSLLPSPVWTWGADNFTRPHANNSVTIDADFPNRISAPFCQSIKAGLQIVAGTAEVSEACIHANQFIADLPIAPCHHSAHHTAYTAIQNSEAAKKPYENASSG